jgi:hypothetical protein
VFWVAQTSAQGEPSSATPGGHADDRAAYTDAKGPFIAQVLATLDADRPPI